MRAWLLATALLGLVPTATDLQQTSAEAAASRVPILLYVSRSDCTFCRRLENEVLNPLIRSGEYEDDVLIRELAWDSATPVRGFDGVLTMPETLADAYAARLTPTLLFLDPQGREIVPRITGYPRGAYFSYYLEEAIREARRLLAGRPPEQPAQG